MSGLYQVSTSPHTRGKLDTQKVMLDVQIALIPAAVMGVINYGFRALLVILLAMASAYASEALFCIAAKRELTIRDLSAGVTGLLLALCLSPSVPWYIPVLGSAFAILFVKCFFGGLGKNFMNPALAARCFLLISFGSVMTNYSVSDAVSSATPLASLLQDKTVNLSSMFWGSASGVIGSSVFALLLGGIYLILVDAISWEIPVSILVSFAAFIAIFGRHGLDPMYIIAHIFGGSAVMSAFFMATDPVTNPVSPAGQLLYGVIIGILTGIFRLYGSAADSGSYAVIVANLVTPLIDEYFITLPFGYRKNAQVDKNVGMSRAFSPKMLGPAVSLFVITILAGVGLAGVFNMTRGTIEEQELKAKLASYGTVLTEAETFEYDESLNTAVAELGGKVYGTDFGRSYINEIAVGKNAAGETVGHVVSVTSADGFDGNITLSLGVGTDGVIRGIEFTELAETAGMGMRCAEPEFKDQFAGVSVEQFVLNKAGGSTEDYEIDSVSGASVSSGAVVNAVNAALDFIHANVG